MIVVGDGWSQEYLDRIAEQAQGKYDRFDPSQFGAAVREMVKNLNKQPRNKSNPKTDIRSYRERAEISQASRIMQPAAWGSLDQIDLLSADELPQIIAEYLAGRQVTIYWQDQTVKDLIDGAYGLANIFDDDHATIQISDRLTIEGQLHALLHECAHIRLDHHSGGPEVEREAVILSRQWQDFACANSYRVGNSKQPGHVREMRACLLTKV